MARVIAVRNLPRVEEAVKLWDKHGLGADPRGVAGLSDAVCLVSILAIDRGYDRDITDTSMYDFVLDAYNISWKEMRSAEDGFMGVGREYTKDLGYYEYGKEIARRVL